jgi:hypothetical protein
MFVYSGGITSAALISGGTLDLMVGGSASGAITFAGTGGRLQIDDTVMPGNTIFGLLPGDTFYLSAVPFDSGGSADLLAGNVLQITEGGHHYDLQLDPSQDFSSKLFELNAVSSGGTLVTEENIPCYCAGTLILTDLGEVEVERLAIGDNLITADGAARPIRWIGKRSYAGRFARGSHVLPICIKAGALDLDQPHRDLWISDRSDVAFIGSFEHAPNVDAVRWLVHEIMPLVWRKAPEIQCLIIGSGLSDELHRELTRPGIDLLGRVDDLAAVLQRIRLTVAPLRFGAGLKDKVLRSLAAGLPCIGTPEAFSGMRALPAAITNLCQRETASELAAAIVRLHRDESTNAACAQIGVSYISAFYSRSRIDELMREIARPALDRHRAARPTPDGKVLNFGERPRYQEGAAATDAEQRDRRIQFK